MAEKNKIIFDVEVRGLGIKDLKSELREMQSQLAAATDPAKMEQFAHAAGQIKDRIAEVNEQIKVMATGSKFEQVSNGLGLIKDQLLSMDFEGAAENAKLLTANIKSMDPKVVAEGFKGLVTTVGQLGNAFLQMGLKLLANPIFLLVAVIVGVVAAIVMLKDKLVIMQKAFDFLTIPIKAVIQLLKDLTDWMGLTSFAAEEMAEKIVKANNKAAESSKKAVDSQVSDLERQIAEQKALGANTDELERTKIEIQRTGAQKQIALAKETALALVAIQKEGNVKLTEEQEKQLADARKTITEQRELVKDANSDLKVIENENIKERQDARDKANQDALAKQEAAQQKARQALEGHLRELAAIEARLVKEREDRGDITEEQKIRRQQMREQAELDRIPLSAEKKAKAQAELDEKFRVLYNQLRIEKENQEKDAEFQAGIERKAQEAQTEIDIATEIQEGGHMGVVERKAKANEDAAIANTQRLENEKATVDAIVSVNQSSMDALSSLQTIFQGKSKGWQAASKALALTQIGIDSAVAFSKMMQGTEASAAGAASSAGPAAPGVYLATKIAFYASGVATILANVAKAKKLLSSGGNAGAASGGGGDVGGAQTQISPSFNLASGVGNNNNTATAAQSVEAGRGGVPQPSTVRAVVVESDITSTQGRVARYQQNSEL